MDRNDTKIQIEELIQNKLFLDLCMNKAEELFGDAVINGDMFRVAYTVIDQITKLIAMTSEPAVDLGWFIWENDCGAKGIREIRTVEDLLDLAELEKYSIGSDPNGWRVIDIGGPVSRYSWSCMSCGAEMRSASLQQLCERCGRQNMRCDPGGI